MIKFELDTLIQHVDNAFNNANNNASALPNEILSMEGMSGIKTRHLYNNICNLDNANYLEIGTWKGSSFVSALYNNNINAIAVDNWAEFNGPKDEFMSNVQRLCPDKKYRFIEKDCFSIEDKEILDIYDSIDIYLYDGAHDYESQRKAITEYSHLFSKYVIIIVDDFRSDIPAWANVSRGTYDGIEEMGLIIHKRVVVESRQEAGGSSEYWNGFGLFICENTKK